MNSRFIHLHNHSHYSLLDGACRIRDLVEAAVENDMGAVALTDHGVMFGAVEFYKKGKMAGVKPILGMEAYVLTKGTRFDRGAEIAEAGGRRAGYHHLVLLAKDLTGYKNLIRLCSIGHTEGFYYKPRIDTEVLRSHSEGLLALSACAGGVVSAHLVSGNDKEAYEAAGIYKNIFGEDFYIEIQNHGLEEEATIRSKAPRLASELGLKLIATNDVHYRRKEHAIPHNIMLLIPDASPSNAPDYTLLRYRTNELYFKTTDEMVSLFKEFPEAIASTLEVADKCNLNLDLTKTYMPAFPIPEESGLKTLDEYLRKLAGEGFAEKYPDADESLRERLEHELRVITGMGFSGYFLIVQDFIRAAREKGIAVGPGRGSAAGSVVSYCLGITSVDPMKYGLLFERFLNPERISMPDIDVDFADDRRDEVIRYVRERYGAESVAQIITFGTLASRAVLKDVGRVLGIPLSTIDSITKQIPVELGKVRPLADALETIPDLQWVRDSTDERIRTLIDSSIALEGLNRNVSTHAAGVVIAPGNVSDYVPLYKTPQTEVMTQYSMKDLETAGLLKIDFLGLRTLTVIENTLGLIARNHGVQINVNALPEDDRETFELFSRGDTVGVFQFESSGMRDWLRKLSPTCISDLVAMNALYRPGPMEMIGDFIERKHGQQQISYLTPKLEPILRETYGVIVYQEQVMRIASDTAGLSLAKADLMRRAMGKKDKALMTEIQKEFLEGAVSLGMDRRLAGEIFDLIEKFASYGFNKSHSVAYSVVAYQTAWLKAHYPEEFMAASLSSEIGDTDRIVKLIEDCRKKGISVLPPDVNLSGKSFTVKNREIRFGLCAIKNVGESAIDTVLKTREEAGGFENIFDFCRRVDLRLVNKKCVESLVQAGAFDSMSAERAAQFATIERAATFGQQYQSASTTGQSSLFDTEGSTTAKSLAYPTMTEASAWPSAETLAREKGVLGFYLSGHPLRKYEIEVNEFSNVRLDEVGDFRNGQTVRLCGIVTGVRKKIDRRNNTMAFIGMEDFSGKAECIVFSDPYSKYQHLLQPDSMVMAVGKGESNGDTLKILVNEVYPLEQVREKFTRSIVLSIDVNSVPENTIAALGSLMEKSKGGCPCLLTVNAANERKVYRSAKYSVDPTGEFVTEARKILGQESVRFVTQTNGNGGQ